LVVLRISPKFLWNFNKSSLKLTEDELEKLKVFHSNLYRGLTNPELMIRQLHALPYIFEASKHSSNFDENKTIAITNCCHGPIKANSNFHQKYISFTDYNSEEVESYNYTGEYSEYSIKSDSSWTDYASDILGLGWALAFKNPRLAAGLGASSIITKYVVEPYDYFFAPKIKVRGIYGKAISKAKELYDTDENFRVLIDDPELAAHINLVLNEKDINSKNLPPDLESFYQNVKVEAGKISDRNLEEFQQYFDDELSKRFSVVTGQIKDLKNFLIEQRENKERQEEKLRQHKKTHQEIDAAIDIGTFIIGNVFGDKELAQKLNTGFKTIHNLYKLTSSFFATNSTVGFLQLTNGYIAGFTIIAGLFGDRKSNLQKGLESISKQINELRNEILQGFNSILDNQFLILNQLEEVISLLINGNRITKTKLQAIERRLNLFSQYSEIKERQNDVEELNRNLFSLNQIVKKKTISKTKDDLLGDFYSYTIQTSRKVYFTEANITIWNDNSVLDSFNKRQRLDYLCNFKKLILQQFSIKTFDKAIPNHIEWARGASALVELIGNFPEMLNEEGNLDLINNVISDGDLINNSLQKMTSIETNSIFVEQFKTELVKLESLLTESINKEINDQNLNAKIEKDDLIGLVDKTIKPSDIILNPQSQFPQSFTNLSFNGCQFDDFYQYWYIDSSGKFPAGTLFLDKEQENYDFGAVYKFPINPLIMAIELGIIKMIKAAKPTTRHFTGGVKEERTSFKLKFTKVYKGLVIDNWHISKVTRGKVVSKIHYLGKENTIPIGIEKYLIDKPKRSHHHTLKILEIIRQAIEANSLQSFNRIKNSVIVKYSGNPQLYLLSNIIIYSYSLLMQKRGLNIESSSSFFHTFNLLPKNEDAFKKIIDYTFNEVWVKGCSIKDKIALNLFSEKIIKNINEGLEILNFEKDNNLYKNVDSSYAIVDKVMDELKVIKSWK